MAVVARQTVSSAMVPDGATVLDNLPSPVLVVDDGDLLVFLNNAAEVFFARSAAQACGMPISALVMHDSPLFLLLQQVRAGGGSVTEHDITLSSPRFHHDDVTVIGTPIENSGHIVLTFTDVKAAKILDRQLAFRSAARSVSGMAALLAHEVRNPLSGIRGAAQLLEEAVSGNDRELAILIRDEVDRIRALVDRMQVFDEKPAGYKPVNIHRVLEHVRALAENGCAAGLRIIERYDPSLPSVWGNRDELIQLFLNLVKNAAEAIHDAGEEGGQGQIVLETSYRPGLRLSAPGSAGRRHLPLVVTVSDTGGGIPDAVRAHLFEPFLTTKVTGSGLGLSLVAKIVDDHGGIIEVESRSGLTSFTLHLPVVAEESGLVA